MSGYYGAGQPPPPFPGGNGQPGNGQPGRNGPRTFAVAAMAVLLIATVVSFALTRSGSTTSSGQLAGTGTASLGRLSAVPDPSFPSDTGQASTAPGPNQGTVSVVPRSATTKPVPPPTTVPPPVTMSVYGVRNVVVKFFDGFLYHRLSDIRSSVCPKYRYLYNGTYVLHPSGYEFQRWRSNTYTLKPGLSYVEIYVAVTLRNPHTGVVGGTWNHTWVITKDHANYYVCGYVK